MMPKSSLEKTDFLAGAMLLVNKPQGWTSFDVVGKLRNVLSRYVGVKRLKVGHSGTLDPMATGLLILCTGKWTKRLAELQGLDKVYTGTFRLGATTPTYDAESEPDQNFPTAHITPELLESARHALCGPVQQVPPMYSAIKKDGVPLYKLARRGKQVELQPRSIEIFEFAIDAREILEVKFRVHCSKGTYIRSLAHDFGKRVESGAYLIALHREKIGDYSVDDAWELPDLVNHIGTLPPKSSDTSNTQN